jgi:hypothetical protein
MVAQGMYVSSGITGGMMRVTEIIVRFQLSSR